MEEYTDVDDVMYELVLVGCGATSKMSSEDITAEFENIGFSSVMFKTLFSSYIFITLVGLLNLIIASMCDTFSIFARTDHQGWQHHSLLIARRNSAGYFIGTYLLQPLFKRFKLIDRHIVQKEGYYSYMKKVVRKKAEVKPTK